MKSPESRRTVMVFDDAFEKYRGYFSTDRWEFDVISSDHSDDFGSTASIQDKVSAFLLDFSWLSRLDQAEEAAFLEKIKNAQVPWVLFPLNATVDVYRKALKHGASGLLHKEKCTYDRTEQDLLEIILHPIQTSLLDQQESQIELERHITLLLSLPTICFPIWQDFFGKNVRQVFEDETIQVLSMEYEKYTIGQFKDIIRTGIYNARANRSSKIQIHYLGRRFRKPEHIADDLKNREQQQPKPSLN